jgi:DNA-binding transcriptional regulator YiaG
MLDLGYNEGMRKARKLSSGKRTPPPGRAAHSPEDKAVKRLVGANLKRLREDRRLSQEEFAEIFGLNASNLNKYEIGKSFPPPSVFRQLSERGVSLDYLFTGAGRQFRRPLVVENDNFPDDALLG